MSIWRPHRTALRLLLTFSLFGTGVGTFLLGSGRLEVSVGGGGIRLTSTPQLNEAGGWLSDRGLLRGLGFNRALAISGWQIELNPAPGVLLPSGTVETGGIRFNEDGEVVEILPAVDDSPCITLLTQDAANPRLWFINCLGDCAGNGLPCTLMIDLATLELRCDCLA